LHFSFSIFHLKKHIQYNETQQFRQTWLWFLLLSSSFIGLLPLAIFVLRGDIPLGEGALALGIVLLITIVNLGAFYIVRLEIKMSGEGIAYRWWPFFRKFSQLSWNEVDHITMRKYTNFKFGAHSHKEFGKVHNVDGVNGYQVVLQNGKKYFFGTQKKLSVETVLHQTGKLKS
jgi:hypothetical protein